MVITFCDSMANGGLTVRRMKAAKPRLTVRLAGRLQRVTVGGGSVRPFCQLLPLPSYYPPPVAAHFRIPHRSALSGLGGHGQNIAQLEGGSRQPF